MWPVAAIVNGVGSGNKEDVKSNLGDLVHGRFSYNCMGVLLPPYKTLPDVFSLNQ